MRITLTLFLGLATTSLLLLAAGTAGATPAHGAKLSPPVIHESFTPLPCAGAHRTAPRSSRRAAPSSRS
jgi:hypothetical protein